MALILLTPDLNSPPGGAINKCKQYQVFIAGRDEFVTRRPMKHKQNCNKNQHRHISTVNNWPINTHTLTPIVLYQKSKSIKPFFKVPEIVIAIEKQEGHLGKENNIVAENNILQYSGKMWTKSQELIDNQTNTVASIIQTKSAYLFIFFKCSSQFLSVLE